MTDDAISGSGRLQADGGESGARSKDGTEQCATEGCHRQTPLVMEYDVWTDELERRERRVCRPCANAMDFRETFAEGGDSWRVQTETDRSGGDGS